MKLGILTCGMLPIPAVQGGAVENLIDFYLEYNNIHKLHDITIYSPWDANVAVHPALISDVNHYYYIDVTSIKARVLRRLRKFFYSGEYYNYFIEYYFEKIYSHLKHQDYDLLILENSDGFAYKLSLRGYKNIVLHTHNERRESKIMYDKTIYNNITKILTVSDYIKGTIPSIFPKEKIKTIYNGIDLKCFSKRKVLSVSRQQIGFSDEDFVMIYSGRINKEKGVSELIDAMLLLKNKPNIKLMIIGGTFFGSYEKEDDYIRSLKSRVKEIENNIIFTGFISYELIPNYLQIGDIAVIPSIWNDPFPTTELEAQAMGLPIITTIRGGIPEEVSEDNAIMLDTEDNFVNKLADAIIYLYEHPEKREQMSIAGIQRSKLFDKETYAKNFFAELEDIS